MRITVDIERLVLDGLPLTGADAPRVRAALEAELASMLAGGRLSHEFTSGGARPRVAAPDISLGAREAPRAIGRAVARSVHSAIWGAK
jgi:hypothetical protein